MKTLVFVVLLVILAISANAVEYTLIDLGRGAASAININDKGQIAGFRYDPESDKNIGFFGTNP